MAKQKQQRWYAVEGDTAYVYDHWLPERSQSVSIVNRTDLTYYRSTFDLRQCKSDPKDTENA